MTTVEEAASSSQGKTVREMVEAVVEAFVRAKYSTDKRASAALYKVSSEIEGAALSARLRTPMILALVGMFRSASDVRMLDAEVKASLFFAAMAGVVRAQFEESGLKLGQEALRAHLVAMGISYFSE